MAGETAVLIEKIVRQRRVQQLVYVEILLNEIVSPLMVLPAETVVSEGGCRGDAWKLEPTVFFASAPAPFHPSSTLSHLYLGLLFPIRRMLLICGPLRRLTM